MGISQSNENIHNIHYPNEFPCIQMEETAYSDLYSLKNCITKIEGQKSDSASSSDIYILTDKNNNTYYMKLFISGITNDIKSKHHEFLYIYNIYPLIYEYAIYLGKINKLVKYNICPFFVTTKGGSLHNTYNDVVTFLKKNINNADNNFNRNIKTILHNMLRLIYEGNNINMIKRLSINDNNIINFPNDNNFNVNFFDTKKINYGYFITESFNKPVTMNSIIDNINNFGNNLKEFLLIFIFQFAISFKSLDYIKISNSDTHAGNVLLNNNVNTILEKIKENQDSTSKYLFFIENKKYGINLPFLIKLYDFDRSYVFEEGYPNKIIGIYENKNNIRNFLLLITDIIKILYYNITQNKNKENSINAINQLSNILIKNDTKKIEIYTNNNINIQQIDYTLEFNNYGFNNNFKSKILLNFIYNIINNENFNLDQTVRNNNLSDISFDSFNNFDIIIENTYNNIDKKFKLDCLDNNCIKNTEIVKYYLSKDFFDKGGVLNKKKMYQKINSYYNEFINKDCNLIKQEEQIEKQKLEEKIKQLQMEKQQMEKQQMEKQQMEKQQIEKQQMEKQQMEKQQIEKQKLEEKIKQQIEKQQIEKQKLEEKIKQQMEKQQIEKQPLLKNPKISDEISKIINRMEKKS
jgi:hypothetical protein